MYFVSVIKLKRTHGLSSKIHFGSEDLTRLARLQLARLSDQRMVTCRDANLLALVIRGWLHHIDASLREKTMRNLMLGAMVMDRLEENEVEGDLSQLSPDERRKATRRANYQANCEARKAYDRLPHRRRKSKTYYQEHRQTLLARHAAAYSPEARRAYYVAHKEAESARRAAHYGSLGGGGQEHRQTVLKRHAALVMEEHRQTVLARHGGGGCDGGGGF